MTHPIQCSLDYVDQLEASGTPHIRYGNDALLGGGAAYLLRHYNMSRDQQAYAALDHGDVRTARAIEAKRASRSKSAAIGIGFIFGRTFWWAVPLTYMLVTIYVLQKAGLATVNQFSPLAAILTVALYTFGLYGLPRHFHKHAASKREAAWQQHYEHGQTLVHGTPITPEQAANDPYAPPPLGPLGDEPDTNPMPSQARDVGPTGKSTSEMLRDLRKKLGSDDTEGGE